MPHRRFRDTLLRQWEVWAVQPSKVERRAADVPVAHDRRRSPEFRVTLGEAMASGWLCFETKGEKRRLAPIPDGWEDVPEPDLLSLCERADPAPAPRRLLE